MSHPTRQFKVIVERDEDGFFVASVPALPGCYTQARTLPLLKKRLRDAIRLCVAELAENSQYRAKVKQFAYEPSFVGLEFVTV